MKEVMESVKKAWGREIILVNCAEYCGKLLCLDKGATVSTHFHVKKRETMYGLKGRASLTIGDDSHLLTPFNLPKTILPGTVHSFYGISNAVILEVSSYHEDEDAVRLTQSQPGFAPKHANPIVVSVDRDGVLEWGNPAGLIGAGHLRRLKEKGYIVGTGGGADATEQMAQWLANGVEPDFALSKGELLSLTERFPNARLVHVDNEPILVAGFEVITPEELLVLLR